MYFNNQINNYTNEMTGDLVNPNRGFTSEECSYNNERLCSQDMDGKANCIWCVNGSNKGKCVHLKDFTEQNCPNSYKTTENFENNQMNTLVSLVIVILIILFLCLIYNGKHK